MKFAVTIDPNINRWDLIRYAEELGYDRAWVPDSQMIWSDCYATLALAAVNTKRIEIRSMHQATRHTTLLFTTRHGFSHFGIKPRSCPFSLCGIPM